MATYYAVCDCNGPISKRLAAETLDAAIAECEAADMQEWIDEPALDAEDDLDIAGDDMSNADFCAALETAGATMVHDLSAIVVGQGPTTRTAHIAGGWEIYAID